jgi:hypothetical protein
MARTAAAFLTMGRGEDRWAAAAVGNLVRVLERGRAARE